MYYYQNFFRYGNCDFLIFNHPKMQNFMKYVSDKQLKTQEEIEELLIMAFSTLSTISLLNNTMRWDSDFLHEQIMDLLDETPLNTVIFQYIWPETQIWNLSQQKIYEFDVKYEDNTGNNNIWYTDSVVEIKNGVKQYVPCTIVNNMLVKQKRKLAIHH